MGRNLGLRKYGRFGEAFHCTSSLQPMIRRSKPRANFGHLEKLPRLCVTAMVRALFRAAFRHRSRYPRNSSPARFILSSSNIREAMTSRLHDLVRGVKHLIATRRCWTAESYGPASHRSPSLLQQANPLTGAMLEALRPLGRYSSRQSPASGFADLASAYCLKGCVNMEVRIA